MRPANVAFNPDHAQGIASSIRVGLAQAPFDARGVLIALADQVAVTVDDLRQLVARWEQQPDRIVAAQYADTIGVPAIFPADLFRELAELQGDRGARVLLSRYPERVIGVPMPSARRDIDTPAGPVGPSRTALCVRLRATDIKQQRAEVGDDDRPEPGGMIHETHRRRRSRDRH